MVKSELCLDKTKISAVVIMTPRLEGRAKQTYPQEGTHCKIKIKIIESEMAWDQIYVVIHVVLYISAC